LVGGNNALAAAELAKLRATDTAQKMFAEEQAASAKAEAKAAEQKSKDERTQQIADAKAAKKEARKTGRREFTKTQLTKMGKDISESASKSKLGQLATGKLADIEEMKSAGMSKFGIAKNLGSQAGQFAADKFKQFAGWLYEILFAIAISIAICMIVIPSIAFFALGLICYFLLRKKLATMKAF